MDFLLLLPINTRFIVSLRQVDLGAFVNALFAVAVMLYAAGQLHLQPTFMQLAASARCGVVGILIHYSLMFMLAAIQLLDGARAGHRVWLLNLFNIAADAGRCVSRRVQGDVHLRAAGAAGVQRAGARAGNMATSLGSLLVLLGLGVVWALISEWFWRISVRRYTSASS